MTGEQFTKVELRKLAKYLRKVYPGVSDQDELWSLIEKVDQLIERRKSEQRG